MIVADTNLIAYLTIPGEHTTAAERVRHRDPDWIAPPLWRSEYGNLLAVCMRREMVSPDMAQSLLRAARTLMTGRDGFDVDHDAVLRIAAEASCSFYDGEFAWLALTRQCPLVTADAKLRRAFPGLAVAPSVFAEGWEK
jgi:predicted nucleic acid-binding protein